MKLGIMQPYFFPYIGYFQLINYVDTYVVYDDVNYIKGGWVNRNNILLNGKKHMVTLNLHKASPNKRINQIEIGKNQNKAIKTIQQSYPRTPFFKEVYPIIEAVLHLKQTNLALLLFESIVKIAHYLDCDTKFLLSSEIPKNNESKGQDKVLHICEILGANQYINAIGGMELYSQKQFEKKSIQLNFLKTGHIEYKQFQNEFIPNLSIIDVLMFNCKETVKKYLLKFELL